MTRKAPLRIGVIGLGKIAQIMHLYYLSELPEFQLTALCDLSREVLDYVGTRYNVVPEHRYLNYHELVQAPIDAVFVLTTNHFPVILAAIDAGKHVFVEKPLCWNMRELNIINDYSRKKGIIVMVGYMKRYDLSFAAALEAIQKLDSVHLIRLHNFAGGRHRQERIYHVCKPNDISKEIEGTIKKEQENAMAEALNDDDPLRVDVYHSLVELCIHDINLQCAIFGPPESIEYSSVFSVGQHKMYLATMLYTGGARCTWEIAPFFDNAVNWDEELAVYTPDTTISVRFANPFIRNAPTIVHHSQLEGLHMVERQIIASYESAFALELRHFAQCIESNVEPLTNPESVREDLRLLINLAKSMDLSTIRRS